MDKEMTLQEFLATPDVDLGAFQAKLIGIGVKRVQHLEDAGDEDLVGIGLTSIELRRLKRSYEKYKKGTKKKKDGPKKIFSKVFGKSKKKDSKSDLKEGQFAEEEEHFVDMGRGQRYSYPRDKADAHLLPLRTSKQNITTVCLIAMDELDIAEEIGKGEFGRVNRGVWRKQDMEIPVAVKCLDERRSKQEQDAFMKEANVMHQIQHDNIIRLYGIVLSEPYRLVTELAPLGCLVDFLRAVPRKVYIYQLCEFSCQIACGMAYLEEKKYIHRDLAARNILLTSEDQVKISDFGLTRAANQGEHTYLMSRNCVLPIAWTAPEALDKKEFTTASDVWSFGITLWEMFSYGAEPYDEMSPVQVFRFVRQPSNGRLQKPNDCPSKVWQIVRRCWEANPIDRPTFPHIERHLKACMPIKMQVKQSYNGKAAGAERLSVWKNEIVTVIEEDSSCYFGQNQAFEVGIFPKDCVVHLGDTTQETAATIANEIPLDSQLKKLSVTSPDIGQKPYMSMRPGRQLCTPEEEYVPMKRQNPQTFDSHDHQAEERAMRLALGENVPVEPPPFQPMGQARRIQVHPTEITHQPQASHVPPFTDFSQQHQVALLGDTLSQRVYPAVPTRSQIVPHRPETEQSQIARHPEFDLYTENGGYECDRTMNNQPGQHSHAPSLDHDHHPHPFVQLPKDISYNREELTSQERSILMERLRIKLPDVQDSDIESKLVECNWNVEEAFQNVRVIQMLDLGLEGSTYEKCHRALEHCQWKIDRAATWLMDSTI